MDDTVWVANNKYNLQKMLNITQEFCNIVDIAINPSKSQVIHINPKSEEKNSPIIINEQAVIPVGKNEPVRYLGVWLTQSGKKTFQRNLISTKVTNACRILNWKKATDKQIRYIVNQVVFPQIEYLLTDLILSKSQCDKINAKILNFFKNKTGFARTAINSLFFMEEGYKIFNIRDRQLQLQGTNWIKRINADNKVETTTRIRLQQYQNEIWQPESVLTNITCVKVNTGHNLTGDILELLKESGFSFPITINNENLIVSPTKGCCLIIQHMNTKWYKMNRPSLRQRRIMYMEQLMNLDFTTSLEWIHLLTFIKANRQGITSKWFESIRQFLKSEQAHLLIYQIKNFYNNINPYHRLNTKESPYRKGINR